jgi:2-keto-4-pentenoate hydratase/2-oxohepta-3-ene-1,7-dioic acid hydratase in catechol pathway
VKLLRYGEAGAEKPGALDQHGVIRDISAHISDIGYEQLGDSALNQLNQIDLSACPEVPSDTRLGPPVSNVRKVVCIGLNYTDHAEESGMEIPSEPVVFMKADTSVCGPNDDCPMPVANAKLDWEVELGIVIGKTAKNVSEADALDYVAGYCVVNDLSERVAQLENTGQWVKGKSHDFTCPFGPVLTTRDEIADVQSLDMWLDIDGQRVQSGNTRTMIFSVAHIVSYLSRHMTLRAGDLIPTGTPPGVGLGMKPPRFLQVGERCTVGIEHLGEISQQIVAPA